MQVKRFRVQNFRNIDDSGWVSLDQVTAFVGRNESGKTTLLKAFHKFNPATAESYDPMREFPRDRYMRDYVGRGSKGGDWPVCSVALAISDELGADIAALLPPDQTPPTEAIATRYYDGSLAFEYEPALTERPLSPEPVLAGLKAFASGARRLEAPAPEQEEATAATRNALAQWATQCQDQLKGTADLRTDTGAKLLAKLKSEAESKSSPPTADLVEALHEAIDPVLNAAKAGPFLRAGPRNLHSRISGNSALWTGRVPEKAAGEDEEESKAQPHAGVQGQGRVGRGARRQDIGRVGPVL